MKFTFLALIILISSCSPKLQTTSTVKTDASSKIINGHHIDNKDPITSHTVLVYNMKEGFACTGTIILKNVVLTAAHCLSRKHNQFQIVFSDEAYLALDQNDMEVIRHSDKVVVHEDYEYDYKKQPKMNQSDIGLVYFRGTIPEGYSPAEVMMDEHLIKKEQVTTIAGYGINKIIGSEVKYKKSKQFQDEIDAGEVMCDYEVTDVDGDPTCLEIYTDGDGLLRKTQANIKFIYASEFVLDEKKSGTCSGDSGGPLYIEENGQKYLAGITSRGTLLCNEDGVYTSVPAFLDWILTH